MKYLIYARISPRGSTWESNESTIPLQIDACRNYVDFQSEEVHEVVEDEFQSAKDFDRPGFSRIHSELLQGTAAWDTIIVHKLDRLTRSLKDALARV